MATYHQDLRSKLAPSGMSTDSTKPYTGKLDVFRWSVLDFGWRQFGRVSTVRDLLEWEGYYSTASHLLKWCFVDHGGLWNIPWLMDGLVWKYTAKEGEILTLDYKKLLGDSLFTWGAVIKSEEWDVLLWWLPDKFTWSIPEE